MTERNSIRRNRRWFLPTLAALLFALAAPSAFATTWFVRTDGGDATQCTGTTDAPYPGTGTGRPCAFKHPFIAMPPSGTPKLLGGDTLVIGNGSYMMGIGAPGSTLCGAGWSYDCRMPTIPSGPSAAQPTRIVGAGWNTGCAVKPELWGTERTARILDLNGSSNVQVQCLEITDHAACIEHHCENGQCQGEIARCNRETAPYGQWASVGIYAAASSNVALRDLNIHGMANRGVLAGGLRDWTVERVKIRANGWSGWDGDVGAASSNSGTLTFRELEVSWNGCAERWPSTDPFACWAQTAGGYGDGFGTARTGGNFVFEDSVFHHNTSDGLDLLYMDGTGFVTVRRTYAEGNAGNQLKASGNSLLENNVVVGNCSFFNGQRNMADGDHCRALGNAVALGTGAGTGGLATLRYNTITGEGDCLVMSTGGGAAGRTNLVNNALIGQTDWRQPWESTCVHYGDNAAPATYTNNLIWNVKSGACPAGSICATPGITSLLLPSFDATPLATSNLVNRADGAQPIADDFRHSSRPSGGAYDI
ncbi:MAG TPA: right-handed parallel beta-helix repeat-containing protein, partial [Xanthomonadales bacterium]|nr:right-handed parallel beta-helix repeat-containing protein [Xanthomonadales bacterium]